MKGGAPLIAGMAAVMLSTVGCGERPQTLDASARKVDAEPWTVSAPASSAFLAPGWTVGDKAAWEKQIRQRGQSQNDYAR